MLLYARLMLYRRHKIYAGLPRRDIFVLRLKKDFRIMEKSQVKFSKFSFYDHENNSHLRHKKVELLYKYLSYR